MAQALSGITKAIIQGNLLAIRMAKSCIATPVLINTDVEQGAKYAIPLMCETNQKSCSAEVSESLIIGPDSKKNVTDNVAPGSKSWHLTGYIPGAPGVEITNFYMPMLRYNVKTLWSWFEHGAVLMYKDGDSNIYDRVIIKDLQTSQQKDSANAVPFSMTLKEINVMETSPLNVDSDSTNSINAEANSMPDSGSAEGNAQDMGTTNAQVVAEAS